MRRQATEVRIGNITVGGTHRIAVQTMTNTDTSDTESTIKQLKFAQECGCDLARLAFNSTEDCSHIPLYKKSVKMPLIADIQFDYRLAIEACKQGIDKIRFNPGNIGDEAKVKELANYAKSRNIPIRVGANSGSIESEFLLKYGHTARALAESCLKHVAVLERIGFHDIVLSVKSSNVKAMIEAYEIIAEKTPYPLHLGVTEAGVYETSVVKSSVGIGALLAKGLGDTVRVSVTGDKADEIKIAKQILRALGLEKNYCEVISCPTCARCKFDLWETAEKIREYTAHITVPLKIAVMGCTVNGPGEAADADLGLAGGNGKAVIFKKGKILKTVSAGNALAELMQEIDDYLKSLV